jgi:glycerol-3-phosphate dehydrogenase (NAD(P)+)
VRVLISRGVASADDFPLLLHVDNIISRGAGVNIPWNSFETETVI